MFRVGQKVVCVDAGCNIGRWYGDEAPIEGRVYSVHSTLTDPNDGAPLVRLNEIERNAQCKKRWGHDGYGAWRFRPIVERKTDISIFTAMLDRASAPSEVEA